MTVRESERRTDEINQHRVLSFADWCRLNGVSPATGRRILKSGKGPVVTQLSARRIGITIGANAEWQSSRARSAD
jgi:predicted site-specific integrase-resolvase